LAHGVVKLLSCNDENNNNNNNYNQVYTYVLNGRNFLYNIITAFQ